MEEAALRIQLRARARIAHRRVHHMRTMRRLVQFMAKNERRAAIAVQQRWLSRVRYRQGGAAIRIQAAAKGHRERSQLKAARTRASQLATEEMARHTAEKAQLMSECTAILEKQGRRRRWSLGKWELVVWQERYVFVNERALVYQHIKANAEPTGAQKEVPFKSMRMIKALINDQLLITCKARTYIFQLGSREEAGRWATNLVQLAADVGRRVPGFVVVAKRSGNDDDALAIDCPL